jgi:hypothetical protein
MAESEQDKPATGFPEPPGKDPGDHSGDPTPHTQLNNPATDPDPTEWPDPYDKRPDPLDPPDPDGEPFGEEPHAPSGAQSTSRPHPHQDVEAPYTDAPERDNLDD